MLILQSRFPNRSLQEEASEGETAASKDSLIALCCSTCNRTGVTDVSYKIKVQIFFFFFDFTRKVQMATEKKKNNNNAGPLTFFTALQRVARHPAATRDLWLTSGSTADILRGERERTPARIPPLPVSAHPSLSLDHSGMAKRQRGRSGYGRY